MRNEKSGRFVIFLVGFLTFWTENDAIGIYRKTGPTKSTVLGPGPPPWRKHEIYRKLTIFNDFGAFNRAGKTVSKIGIYSKPPPEMTFYRIFINSRPNFVPYTIFLKFILTMGVNNLLPIPFFKNIISSMGKDITDGKVLVFSVVSSFRWVLFLVRWISLETTVQT
jgi:hypothetical protein